MASTSSENANIAAQIEKIGQKAKESNSSAVVILRRNDVLLEWSPTNQPSKPIELMSCTKSIVSLLIGRLIDQGTIKSLDQPVCDFFPEWRQGDKRLVTLRHLLNHTSGLQNVPDTTQEIYPSPDFVKLALAAELTHKPGEEFAYNNKAVNLLAGIIQIASGQRMDEFCGKEFFQPMGISKYKWTKDKAGNPHAMSGLELNARDFAKFGQLLVNQGVWNGEKILSEERINEILAAGQNFEPKCGLLWWRIPEKEVFEIDDSKFRELEAANADKDFLQKLEPLRNKTFEGWEAYGQALASALGPDFQTQIQEQLSDKQVRLSRRTYGKFIGYEANGYLGQYLVVLPEARLVAVRQIRATDKYDDKTDGFDDFTPLIVALGNSLMDQSPEEK